MSYIIKMIKYFINTENCSICKDFLIFDFTFNNVKFYYSKIFRKSIPEVLTFNNFNTAEKSLYNFKKLQNGIR